MMLGTSLFLLSLSFSAVLAQYGDAGPSSPPSTASTPGGSTLTGDTQCSSANTMCVSAVVDAKAGTTQYSLQSTGSQPLGWMAMGFGTTMANAAMVIMWPNSNGNITLSQRSAPGEVMPTVDPNPPTIATSLAAQSIVSGSNPQLVFTVPSAVASQQNIVYAFGTNPPNSPAVDAPLQQHIDSGPLTLDLTKPLSSKSTTPPAPPASHRGFQLAYYEKLIIGHAILCTFGFLFFLPAGALLARYLRTFSSSWFQGHWIIQFAIGGVVIITGVALGMQAVVSAGALHFNDVHKRWGIVILVLYFLQCGLGAFIHWVKPRVRKGRPPQNYFHAVLGLTIIGLAFYQVRTGYKTEWPSATGLPPLSYGVDAVYYTWVVLLPLLYTVGLAFLPRQFDQEKPKVQTAYDKEFGRVIYRI